MQQLLRGIIYDLYVAVETRAAAVAAAVTTACLLTAVSPVLLDVLDGSEVHHNASRVIAFQTACKFIIA